MIYNHGLKYEGWIDMKRNFYYHVTVFCLMCESFISIL